MLSRLGAQEKFCPQFHLSLQSGCDATLKRMNRHYDSAFYYDLVTRIRNIFPDAAITTDIMVGFAGETEQDFIESLEFCRSMGFATMHVFAYSKREGTKAYNFSNQVENSVKEARSKSMSEMARASEKEFLESQIGKTVTVLFEKEEKGFWWGYSENYSYISVKSKENLNNKILTAKIEKAFENHCEAILI
jgi:threonylcarbamoyladenosine tRNA methylthiotransferase MtaB